MTILSPEALVGQASRDRGVIAHAWAESRRALKAALLDARITEVVVMVGTPGSGKSTWAAANDLPHRVIFDAVFADPGRRRQIARQIRAAGKDAICVWVRTPLDECLRRQALRPVWRRVPGAVCHRAALAFHLHPPRQAGEGWSQLLQIDGTM